MSFSPRPAALEPTSPVRAKRVRVAFVIDRIAQRSGGAERVLIETANALAARGHQVEIITHEYRGAPPFYELRRGVILSNLRPFSRPRWRRPLDKARSLWEKHAPDWPGLDRITWASRNGSFWRRLGAHLRATRPDAVVAFMPPAITALGLARVDHPMRRIASLHNAPEQDFSNPERWDPSRLDRKRRLALLSRMDQIAVLLPEYQDWFPESLRPHLTVLPNAVQPVPEALRAGRRSRVVLSIGRLAAVKRHGLLLDAWARLAPDFPDWRLRIYGEGPLRGELERKIASRGLRGAELMGHHPNIAEQYLSAAILAHPAEFEGFPLAVTEALASGLPVVGFEDCSGLNRLVRDGENGLLVPAEGNRTERFAQALAALMADHERREALGAAGPQSVADYGPDAIVGLWERMILADE